MYVRHRRPATTTGAILLGVAALAGARWMAAHPALAALLAAVAVAAGVLVVRWRVRRGVWAPPVRHLVAADPYGMNARQFEHFLAELCLRDGCRDVEVVGGSGDRAADVLYTDPHGRRGLIQAKRYTFERAVGDEHIQRVNGTYRSWHRCQHASVVTTSHRFTPPAQQFAQYVGIELVDAHRLDAWMRGHSAAAPWNRATAS